MTCFAPRRCFQFGFLRRARSRKCTSVLLLPGCRSQNTCDSKGQGCNWSLQDNVSPKKKKNLFAIVYLGKLGRAHVLEFMRDALHDKPMGSGVTISATMPMTSPCYPGCPLQIYKFPFFRFIAEPIHYRKKRARRM